MSTSNPTPPSANPDPAPDYNGGTITNRQVLDAIEYSPIGGGKGLPKSLRVSEEDADYVVRTAAELARRAPEAGKVVYIPGDASIDLSNTPITVRATIASNRGRGGSEGALVYSNARTNTARIKLLGTGRIAGLRFRGFAYNYHRNPEHPGYIGFAPGDTVTERSRWRSQRSARGISIQSSTTQIDNCEIYGWSYSALHIGGTSVVASPNILYCHLHDNMLTSAGYAAEILKGIPKFRFCYFNAHRHALAGFGFPEGGFVIEDSIFGASASSFQVDMHGLHNNFSSARTVSDYNSPWFHGQAGGNMAVRRTTHLYTHVIPDANYDTGKPCAAVSIRGVPSPRRGNGIVVERNAFSHGRNLQNPAGGGRAIPSTAPCHQQTRKSGDQAFNAPTGPNGFTPNYHIRDNSFNVRTSPPAEGHGAPIDLRNPPEGVDEPDEPIPTPIPEPVGDPWLQDPDPTRRLAVAQGTNDMIDGLESLQEITRQQ